MVGTETTRRLLTIAAVERIALGLGWTLETAQNGIILRPAGPRRAPAYLVSTYNPETIYKAVITLANNV